MSLPASARRPTDVDLSVRIGTVCLSNPVIAASGTFGYGAEFAHLVDLNSLGGIVVKGLSAQPLGGAPPPRLCESPAGMLNAVGLQNIGVRAFIVEKLPQLRKYRTAVITNVFGHTVAEYVEVIHSLEDADGVAAYELNISCPNVDHGGSEFGLDASLTTEVVSAAKKTAARRPLWVKLAPNADVATIARAAADAGADALTVANTYPAMSIDSRSGKSRLGRLMCGLSGPAIKPLTIRLVHQVSRTVTVPVIGLGGIETANDAMEYLMAGATAIQVGTAHFADPNASRNIAESLRTLCINLSIFTINDLHMHRELGLTRKSVEKW